MFDALVVTPIRIFFVLIFIGTAYTFVFRRTWDKWRMARLQKTLSGHIVVAGFGTSGSEAVDELIARGARRADIVVIDCEEEALERAESLGCAILQADATRDKTLSAVHIDRARALIVSAGSDDTSILITLTARHLAPTLTISVAVRNEDNELLARQAGATTVINPVSFAGLLLAGSTHGAHIADYIADLASSSGRVQLHEREVTPRGMRQAALRDRQRPRRPRLSRRHGPTASGSPRRSRSGRATASSRSCRPRRPKRSSARRRGQLLSRAGVQTKGAGRVKVTVPIHPPTRDSHFYPRRLAISRFGA